MSHPIVTRNSVEGMMLSRLDLELGVIETAYNKGCGHLREKLPGRAGPPSSLAVKDSCLAKYILSHFFPRGAVLGFVDEPMKQLHKKISLKEQLEEAIAEIGRDDPLEGRGFEQEPGLKRCRCSPLDVF
jgi:hypothetical protein